MSDSLLVLILAGGEGRRIGGGKPERLLGGQRLLDRAVCFARQHCGEPVAAVRLHHDFGPDGVRIVRDRDDLAGPLAGLAAGVELAAREGAKRLLLLPVDMPFLPPDLSPRLAAALENLQSGCAMAASYGRRHPVCSLWQVDRLSAILPCYCASGQRSLMGLAETVGFVAVEWSAEKRDPFFNINGADDLAYAEAALR